MPATVLVGTQWGDEGKGKVTDLISGDYDIVCRYAGGANAGHTVITGNRKLALHQVPSGVMYEGTTPIIGNGCIVDPEILLGEIDMLEGQGISCDALKISGNAHIVMPYHKDLDGAHEKKLGKNLIGTTKRGVGPTYMDKMNRTGLRMQDMLDEKIFRKKLEAALAYTNPILEKVYELPTYGVDQICETYLPMAARIRPYICESSLFLNNAIEARKSVLFEGAQATMLDIDHGTYPFVTSSNCTAGGAVTGSGVGPVHIQRVLGIAKAYLTRVGSGPFPTELFDETGDLLGEVGHEYGVTTGRKRRCGWYDAVVVNYAARVNGLTDLAITKLDVLGCLDEIKVCVAYECDGVRYTTVPEHQSVFYHAKPVYETLPGWKCDITGVRDFYKLPREAKDYIDFLEQLAGVTAHKRGPYMFNKIDILLLGAGGREHALLMKLAESPRAGKLFVAPGNGGMFQLAEAAPIDQDSPDEVADWAERHGIGLVVVGPEAPLVAGVADAVRAKGIPCFGPNANAARMEGSKEFAKQVMSRAGVPTAAYRSFTNRAACEDYVRSLAGPCVIKADGLAAGKGVIVAQTTAEALDGVAQCFGGAFGDAGSTVVVEEMLEGPECSLLALTDSKTVVPLATSQDHKRAYDGDKGPNTGGMGVYSPVPSKLVSDAELATMTSIMRRVVAQLSADGINYSGCLYGGFMLTKDGPKVLEFNARFGDPETQVVLPRMHADLLEVFLACDNGTLDAAQISWGDDWAVSVVLASDGYPGSYETGKVISGIEEASLRPGITVYHAGTKLLMEDGRVLTAGGRVLDVTAVAPTFAEARANAYAACDLIDFEGKQLRHDIGARAL